MPRFRFTVRGMMVVVAIVALVIWGANLRQLSSKYRSAALVFADLESSYRLTLRGEDLWLSDPDLSPDDRDFYAFNRIHTIKRVNYYAKMKQKYERAARYPWLTVAPDPPEPEYPDPPEPK